MANLSHSLIMSDAVAAVLLVDHSVAVSCCFFNKIVKAFVAFFSREHMMPTLLNSSLARLFRSPADKADDELEMTTVCHRPEGLDQLEAQSNFTKQELQILYRGFKNVIYILIASYLASGAYGGELDSTHPNPNSPKNDALDKVCVLRLSQS